MNSRVFIATGLALLVNFLLFVLLPLFAHKGLYEGNLETIIPVNIIQFKRPEVLPPEEEKEELPEKKQPEKVIPTIKLKPHKRAIPQRLEIETPHLSFEINPRLTVGMPVAPPPKEPTIFRPKDSYPQGEVDQMPIPIFKMKPIYPYRAKRLNISGAVEVKFLVDTNGYVSNIKILNSYPRGIFDKSVLRALPSWKFSPGKVREHPVSTWVITTIEFKMEEA
jgi:protein TonB